MNCNSSTYCCKRRYIDNKNVCLRSCVGETCDSILDCGGPDESYSTNAKKCEESDATTLTGWVIPVIIVCAVLSFVVVGGGWWYRGCRGSSRLGVVGEDHPAERTTGIIAPRQTHIPAPPVYNSSPPPYYNYGQNQVNKDPSQPQNYPAHQPLQLPQSQP